MTDIRLIKNAAGKSKGYAYVEFSDELAVEKALGLDRTPVDGRPMYVSKCEDKKNKPTAPVFKVRAVNRKFIHYLNTCRYF